jgi:hypothetical protein
MAVTVPNPPYKTPFLTPSGFLSQPWTIWIRELFVRVGGSVAESNLELASSGSLATTNGRVTALETLTTTHTAQIANLEDLVGTGDGLDQGRAL